MGLAAAGQISPIMAAVLHVVSGLVVIFNSARLVRVGGLWRPEIGPDGAKKSALGAGFGVAAASRLPELVFVAFNASFSSSARDLVDGQGCR